MRYLLPNLNPVCRYSHAARRIAVRLLLCTVLLSTFSGALADQIKIGGTGGALGTVRLLADAFQASHPDTQVQVLPSLGSGGGIKALLAGAIQIAVSARPLKDAEAAKGAVQQAYGRTPFVFATHADTAVGDLSIDRLVDIYAGDEQQWPDGRRIRLVLRPLGDSDSKLVRSISPAMREAKENAERRKGMSFAITDQDSVDNIEKIPGSLGTTTLAQIISERRAVKALPLDGVEPSVQSLAEGRYPLSKQFFIVTTDRTPDQARAFVAFIRSPAGAEILRQAGHWLDSP